MNIYVYPGSFDPVTNGHVDIIERASKLCDKLIVAVLVNSSKQPAFSLDERVEMIREAIGNRTDVEVRCFSGLLIDFMKEHQARVIIKGLRAVSDFEYELQMANLNKTLDSEIETLFMMTSVNYSFLSSSSVKEIARHGGSIDELVPGIIRDKIMEKYHQQRQV